MNVIGFSFFSIICLTILGKSIAQEPRIVCYYTNWSVYRGSSATFNIENYNSNPCTHLIYAYAGFTDANTIEPTDSYADLKIGGYSKFTGLKRNNNNLKTLLSIRSNNDKSKYSPLVGNETRKPIFIENAISYLRKYNFDGLDLDWQHPTYGNDSKPEDRENYARFVQELREAFEWESSTTGQSRLLLTLTVPQFTEIIDQGYDVEKLNQYSDWLNIVTYNYYNESSPTTRHHAPLYAIDGQDPTLNVNFSINYYISAGAERQKLVIGVPTYGRSYTLSNSSVTGIGAPTNGAGRPGNLTGAAGTLAYYEICQNIISKDNWTVIQPEGNVSGPYLYKNDQWIGYDDEQAIRTKARYIVEEGLGGMMFWTIDLDDFRGSCSDKSFPLIEAAKEVLFDPLNVKPMNSTDRIVKSAAKRNRTATKSARIILPESKTSLKSENEFPCEVDGFFPHPTDCKKYIFCKFSEESDLVLVPQELTCPADLLFNVRTNVCDYARKVVCLNSDVPAFTTESTPATIITTTPVIATSSIQMGRAILNDVKVNRDPDPEELKKLVDFIKMSSDMLENHFKPSANDLPKSANFKSGILRTSQAIQNNEKLDKSDENGDSSDEDTVINRKQVTIQIHNSNVTWLVLVL